MTLSTTELSTCKRYLKYPNLTVLASPWVDVPAVFETVVAPYLDAYGETYVRTTLLPNLQQSDVDIQACRTRMVAKVVDEVTLNPDEMKQLRQLRRFWIRELSHVLGIPEAKHADDGSCVEVT